MIRSELINRLCADHPDLIPHEVETIAVLLFDAMTEQLTNDGRVELRGFGTFTTRPRNGRIGRNPRTGVAVEVHAKRVPYFKPGKEMRARLNV